MQTTTENIPKPKDMAELHRLVVQAAILAPSAENTQPWHFRSEGDRLIVYRDRRRSLASDINGMLDYTGLGAAIENGVIAARHYGFEPTVNKIRPSDSVPPSDPLVPIAELAFAEGGQPDSLFAAIETRCTSRRMDGSRPIPDDVLTRMSDSIRQFPDVRVDWVTDRQQIKQIAKLVGIGNRIRFEVREFHAEFYENIRWTNQEAEQTRDGLDVATLQLPWGVASVLSTLRFWSRMRIANAFGFSHSVARQATSEVCNSSALGLLTVGQSQAGQFLDGGRAFERIWLTATSENTGLHPTASLPVFLQYARLGQVLPGHVHLMNELDEQFDHRQPDLRGRTLQMALRVGHADVPSVRSLRRVTKNALSDMNSSYEVMS